MTLPDDNTNTATPRNSDVEFLRALAVDLVITPDERSKWGDAPERLRAIAAILDVTAPTPPDLVKSAQAVLRDHVIGFVHDRERPDLEPHELQAIETFLLLDRLSSLGTKMMIGSIGSLLGGGGLLSGLREGLRGVADYDPDGSETDPDDVALVVEDCGGYASGPQERCEHRAASGRALGNRCILRRSAGHLVTDDVHVYGTPEYERAGNEPLERRASRG